MQLLLLKEFRSPHYYCDQKIENYYQQFRVDDFHLTVYANAHHPNAHDHHPHQTLLHYLSHLPRQYPQQYAQ